MAIKINFEKYNYSNLYNTDTGQDIGVFNGNTLIGELGVDTVETVYNPQKPTFVLMTKSGRRLGIIPAESERVKGCLNAADEISFTVHKTADTKEMSIDDEQIHYYQKEYDVSLHIWENLVDFKLLWCREWNKVFEIYVETEDGEGLTKYITATSLGEAELSQLMLYNIEINTETDISRDDYDEKYPTILYRPSKPEASLLHRITEKAEHYTIGHVDKTIRNIQRTFTFDNTSIYDAFQQIAQEIGCLFKLDCYLDSAGNLIRQINVYDLQSYCLDCTAEREEELAALRVQYSFAVEDYKWAVKTKDTANIPTLRTRKENLYDEIVKKKSSLIKRGEFFNVCPDCGSTNVHNGYGKDTTIFVSTDNLTDSVRFTTDTGSVKNCFKLEAGDDYMTATVINTNPNGSGYIWYIPPEVRADMSDELRYKLDQYDRDYEHFMNDHVMTTNDAIPTYNGLVRKYNKRMAQTFPKIPTRIIGYANIMEAYYNVVDFYHYLSDSMMPDIKLSDTTAQAVVATLKNATLSPVAVAKLSSLSLSSANSAVLQMAKVVADNRYKVTIESSSLDSGTHVWTGKFKVVNNSNADDKAVGGNVRVRINDDMETFIEQKIKKTLKQKVTNDATDIVALFDLKLAKFKKQIKLYSLNMLSGFYDSAKACVNIMVEQGVADKKTWGTTGNSNVYKNLYKPYLQKLRVIEREMKQREADINFVHGKYNSKGKVIDNGIQNLLENRIEKIQYNLDINRYIAYWDPEKPSEKYGEKDNEYAERIGKALWKEFISYRREDTYSNSNYISDGMENGEVIKLAQKFLEEARKEVIKSATMQHSISTTLANLLVMEEFKVLVKYFEVGNWIRVRCDDNIYRLRISDYEIDYDNLENITINFTDVTNVPGSTSDVKSVLSKASSMSSSYGAVTRQADNGASASTTVKDWVKEGLSLTTTKIVESADNQNITWDSNGLLAREYDTLLGGYTDRQLKIINQGLYVTDDNWNTSKAGIGSFNYWNPMSKKYENAYGVIADTIVGNIILGETVGIYNTEGTTVINKKGITITADQTASADNRQTLTLQRKTSSGTQKLLYLDTDGTLYVTGKVNINTSAETEDVIHLKYQGTSGAESGTWETLISPGKYTLTKTNNAQTIKYDAFFDSRGYQFTKSNYTQYSPTTWAWDVSEAMVLNQDALVFGMDSSSTNVRISKSSLNATGYDSSSQKYHVGLLKNNALVLYESQYGASHGELPPNAVSRAAITCDSTSSKLILRDSAGTSRVEAIFDSSGTNRFTIRDSNGQAHMLLTASGLDFKNSSGTTTASYPDSLTASRVLVSNSSNAVSASSVTTSQLSASIISMGTTDGWHWIKRSDNSVEMWKHVDYSSLAMTTASGNLYRSDAQTASYPSGFFSTIAIPQVTCESTSATFATLTGSSDTSKAVYYVISGGSATRSVKVNIHVWGK